MIQYEDNKRMIGTAIKTARTDFLEEFKPKIIIKTIGEKTNTPNIIIVSGGF